MAFSVFADFCSHHRQSVVLCSKGSPYPSLCPSPPAPSDHSSTFCLHGSAFWTFPMNEITEHPVPCDWILLFPLYPQGSSILWQVLVFRSFLQLNNSPRMNWRVCTTIVRKYHIRFVYPCSSVDGHLGCFQIVSFMDKAAMSFHSQVPEGTYAFISLGPITRSVSAWIIG